MPLDPKQIELEKFQQQLPKIVGKQICAYFYKRKKEFTESKPAKKGFSFGKLLEKIQSVKSKYIKRFYVIDSISSQFIQAENETLKNITYKALYRDIIRVTKNMVTMPIKYKDEDLPSEADTSDTEELRRRKKNQRPNSHEVNIHDVQQEVDRGPNGFHFVIEIHLNDRMFTLYTDSKMQ